jgi:hypothetical protein
LDPKTGRSQLLDNLSAVFSLARTHHLKLYITALNAGDASVAAPSNYPYPTERIYFQNLFSNKKATTVYENKVLGPILGLMSLPENQGVIYGFDLINEIEAAINAGYFFDFWFGARTWIQNMTAFVKSYPCAGAKPTCKTIGEWLPVTSSAGGGYAVQEVTLGLFSGLGLNFYDVHIYRDSGTYSGQTALCFKTRFDNSQIVLGEFGQKSTTKQDRAGDTIQNSATTNFLNGAKNSCFSSALAWKYELLGAPWLSYLYVTPSGDLSPACTSQPPGPACFRPAYTTIKNFVR